MRSLHFKYTLIMSVVVSAVFVLSCDGTIPSTQKTDMVVITDINSRISEADIKAGTQKTNNFVSAVKMSHVIHEKNDIKCVVCHHANGNDDRIKQCAACHKGGTGRDVMHNFCIECHVKVNKGPVMCQNCHKI